MARWSIRTGNSRLLVYREQRERDSTRTSYQAVSYVVLKVTLPDAGVGRGCAIRAYDLPLVITKITARPNHYNYPPNSR